MILRQISDRIHQCGSRFEPKPVYIAEYRHRQFEERLRLPWSSCRICRLQYRTIVIGRFVSMAECELEIQERSKYIQYIRGNCISVILSLNHPNSGHNSAYYTGNIFIYEQTYPLAVLQALSEQTSTRLTRSEPQILQSSSHDPMSYCRTYSCGVWRPGFPCSESRNLMVAACEWLPPTSLTNKYAMLISRCSTATSGAHFWSVMHGKSTALQRAPKLPHCSIYSVDRTPESRLKPINVTGSVELLLKYPPTADHVATISMRSRSSQVLLEMSTVDRLLPFTLLSACRHFLWFTTLQNCQPNDKIVQSRNEFFQKLN